MWQVHVAKHQIGTSGIYAPLQNAHSAMSADASWSTCNVCKSDYLEAYLGKFLAGRHLFVCKARRSCAFSFVSLATCWAIASCSLTRKSAVFAISEAWCAGASRLTQGGNCAAAAVVALLPIWCSLRGTSSTCMADPDLETDYQGGLERAGRQ